MSHAEAPPAVNPHVARWACLRSRLHSLVLHEHALPALALIAERPRTTGGLAHQLGIHATAIGHIVGILRVRGLISTEASGLYHCIVHRPTADGATLAAALAPLACQGVA